MKIVTNSTQAHLACDGVLRLLAQREIHVSAALTMLVYLSGGVKTDDPSVPTVVHGIACELQRFVVGRTTRISILGLTCPDHLPEVLAPDAIETTGHAWTAIREFIVAVNRAVSNYKFSAPLLTAGSFMTAGLPDTISVMLRIPAVYVDVQASICSNQD